MKLRRLLPMLALLALIAAPFGRMAAAEAMAPNHGSAPVAGHCRDMPGPGRDQPDRTSLDCMIACAAMAAALAPALDPVPRARLVPAAMATPGFAGLHPEADPPPPRFS